MAFTNMAFTNMAFTNMAFTNMAFTNVAFPTGSCRAPDEGCHPADLGKARYRAEVDARTGTMTWAQQRCSLLALARDEPLAGTAPVARRWVCVEQRGAWPSDLAAHPEPALAALASTPGWRLLLIRRPGRRGEVGAPLRVYLADTAPRTSRTTTFCVDGPEDLADLTLPALDEPLPGRPVSDPLLLVCTHGRRDRCCAVDGRALITAVVDAGEQHVWECSHLGGHRFAPTALVLPTGYAYGRLDPATAIAARKAAFPGEVDTAQCRGRSTWSPAGQVAELAVRATTGLRDADALQVFDAPAGALVSARDGRRWAVDVAEIEGAAPRPPSCGADPAPFTALHATAVHPLP
jgi:sucrase/ferredoxin-like protein